MGLTQQYLRYLPSALFGVIGSQRSNIVFLNIRNTVARYVAIGACENVNIWDTRTQEKVAVLQGDKYEVTVIAASPDREHLATGYSDGTLRIFSLITGEINIVFAGHRSAVSCLAYDADGMRLASGSHDTDLVVWDLVNESGLYRLKGHKGIITQCTFLKTRNMLVSSSKDTYVKWWDLDTQHCFKTMVTHRAEVWAFAITPDERRLITGSADSELRVWSLDYIESQDRGEPPPAKLKPFKDLSEVDDEMNDDLDHDPSLDSLDDRLVTCTKLGSVMRRGRDRVVSLLLSSDGRHLACHGNDKTVELFRVCTEEEVGTKLKKKLKRARKKIKQQETEKDGKSGDQDITVERTVEDEVVAAGILTCASKLSSLDIAKKSENDLVIAGLHRINQFETFSVDVKTQKPQINFQKRLCLPGHRTECRSIFFTSDGLGLLTAASQSAKLWNRSSNQCVRTLKCQNTQCSLFVPGDRQVLLGTQSGSIEIHDIASGEHLETISGHESAVSSLCLTPDQRGAVSGGSDKTVKFWDFDLVADQPSAPSSKRLTLVHTRTLELEDQVLAVELSSNRKLIAISLLDCTVKVFYVDTLKFFLSLYAHSLPAKCISISTDSSLIVTGSSDRNVKIWGLDFGDCHRSLFAHDDDVTSVKFVPDTHLFFSAGKDGLIKQWDADKFTLIQLLRGHIGPIYTLAVSEDGDHVASCGRDRSIRFWQRSSEVVIPDEDREQEREEEEEKQIAKTHETVVPGESTNEEVGMASKTTIESVKATERIMEALELYREERDKEEEHLALQKKGSEVSYVSQHPILKAFGNISASRYFLQVLRKVKSSELEEALLVLPFSYVPDLLALLNTFVRSGQEVELSCRCTFFLSRIHLGRITSNQMLLDVLNNLPQNTDDKLNELRDRAGFNLAALDHIRRRMEARKDVTFFSDATQQQKQKTKKKRKRERLERAVITM